MVKSANIRDMMKPSSNSLVSMCVKCVGKNMKRYENDECFGRLPKHLKVKIVRFVTRCLQEMHPASFQMLLNDEITTLNLVSFEVNDNLLLEISEKCPKLRSLYIRGNTKSLTKTGILRIPKLKYLEKLEILNSNIVDDEFIKSLARSCTMLRLLSIPGSNISDESFDYLKQINLKNLNVSKTKISDEFVKELSLSELGKNLEELCFSDNANVTNKGLSYLPWKSLKYVSFHGCDIDETIFDTIRPTTKFMVWSIPK